MARKMEGRKDGRKKREREKEGNDRKKEGREKKIAITPNSLGLNIFTTIQKNVYLWTSKEEVEGRGHCTSTSFLSPFFLFFFFFFSPSFLFPNENTDVDGSRIRTTWKQRNCRKSVDGEDHDVQEVRSQIVLHLHLFLLRT